MTGGRRRVRVEGRPKEDPIFNGVEESSPGADYASGFDPGRGTFFCVGCGAQLELRETDRLPRCAECGGGRYRRDSIFIARQEHGHPTAELDLPGGGGPPEWLAEARRSLAAGNHLVLHEEGRLASFAIERGWTRIGRSEAAEVRFDDPTVSRRHALIVAEPGRQLRVLDDRSLNGVLLNGRRVEWAPLGDGDELVIGRHRLYLVHA